MTQKKKDEPVQTIYKLRIWLNDITPRIVRRVEVPANMSLVELHGVIQIVMGWKSAHLFQFKVGSDYFGLVDPDFDDGYLKDCTKLSLEDLGLAEKASFLYQYDFGDGWDHDIRIEKISASDPQKTYPYCVSGKRACPPEDSGGPYFYQQAVEQVNALRAKGKPLPEELEWNFGAIEDFEKFDIKLVRKGLIGGVHRQGNRMIFTGDKLEEP